MACDCKFLLANQIQNLLLYKSSISNQAASTSIFRWLNM